MVLIIFFFLLVKLGLNLIYIVFLGRVCGNLVVMCFEVLKDICIIGKLNIEIFIFSKKKIRKKMRLMSLLVLLFGDR